MEDTLHNTPWADAEKSPITPDWSPRQFWRLRLNGRTAVLMRAPEDIPGHGLSDFIRIAGILRDAGLSAPEIYDVSGDAAIIEDFGDTPIDAPAIEREAYECAVDVLGALRNIHAPLTKYKDGYIYEKLALFSGDPAWMKAWADAEAALPPAPYVFSHMDYKAGNLHWLADRRGIRRIGLLDFQAAQAAPFTYDIVNLLEDARRDLDPDLKARLKARFHDALPAEWKPVFQDWYAFMAAQFHARVLGQIRGNPRVAPDVEPRLRAYLKDAPASPHLVFLRKFFK